MWFAALGSYNHNPWLINFIDKLLVGCKPVIQLIDEEHLMNDKDNLLAIRAVLYTYDFTRIDTEWNQRIPGIELVSKKNGKKKWWSRQSKGNYLPVIEPDNDSVKSFLNNYRFSSKCFYNEKSKCKDILEDGSAAQLLCNCCSLVRNYHLFWIPVILVLVSYANNMLYRR